MLEISWPKLLFLSTFFNNFLRFSQFLTSSCFFPGVGGLRFWDATLLFARGWLAWWSPYRTQDDPMQRLGPLRWYQVGGCLPCQLFQALGREGLEPMGRSRASGIPLLKRLLNMDCPMKKRREGCAFCLPFSWKSRNPHKLCPYVFQHSLQVGGFHKFSPTALRPSSKTSCGLIWKWYTPKSNDWLSCSPIKVYQSIWTLHFGGGGLWVLFPHFQLPPYLPMSNGRRCSGLGNGQREGHQSFAATPSLAAVCRASTGALHAAGLHGETPGAWKGAGDLWGILWARRLCPGLAGWTSHHLARLFRCGAQGMNIPSSDRTKRGWSAEDLDLDGWRDGPGLVPALPGDHPCGLAPLRALWLVLEVAWGRSFGLLDVTSRWVCRCTRDHQGQIFMDIDVLPWCR